MRVGQQLTRLLSHVAQVLSGARRIRDIDNAKSFIRWCGRGLAWWWREVRGRNRPMTAQPKPVVALGLEVATVGQKAREVFGDFAPPPRRHDFDHVDVVLADTSSLELPAQASVVVLSEHPQLAVPAFDPATFNPIGWQRDVKHRVAALGPRHLLPRALNVNATIKPTDIDKARRFHHVVDTQEFHQGPEERAGLLVRLAASGIPIHLADSSRDLEHLVGSELYGLMKSEMPSDAGARELLSIAMRRCALRDHSLRRRAGQVSHAAGQNPLPLPDVSIVLATKRPKCLHFALSNVAKQDYPSLELILALHGSAFRDESVEQAIGRSPVPVTVVRVAACEPLGTALRVASEAASGSFITKMDDDDLYHASHVGDLMSAYEYSGAQLVGKYHEVTYLADIDKTIEVQRGKGEAYAWHVSGAALVISRHELANCGGWRRIPSSVDVALVDDVIRAGGAVYRTHGAGLVSIRHGRGHTWATTDDRELERANRAHDGWHPGLAGIRDVPRPPRFADPRRASEG